MIELKQKQNKRTRTRRMVIPTENKCGIFRTVDRLQGDAVCPGEPEPTLDCVLCALCEGRGRRGTHFELLISRIHFTARIEAQVSYSLFISLNN